MGEVAVYRRLVGARIRGELQYRVSFTLFTIAQLCITLIDAVGILLIFHNVSALGDWSERQVLFLYAVSTTGFGIADLFVSAVADVGFVYVRSGTFDRYYLRPASLLLQVLADEFALRRIGKLLQAVGILAVVLALGAVDWSVGRVGVLALTIAFGAVMFAGLFVLTSVLSFWSPGSQEVANSFTYGGVTAANYPMHVFGDWLRRFATFLVPVAAVAYLPGIYLTGAPNPLGVPMWAQLASPLLAVPVAVAGAFAWRAATRHYQSTGS